MLNKASQHGQTRANQRGFNNSALKLIQEYGTPIDDRNAEAYVMTQRDVERAIGELKRNIQTLEKLGQCKMVCSGDRLITVHRLNKNAWKRTAKRLAS